MDNLLVTFISSWRSANVIGICPYLTVLWVWSRLHLFTYHSQSAASFLFFFVFKISNAYTYL